MHWTTCLGSVHKISSDISFTIIEYLFNPKEKETELPIYTGALIQQWSKTPEAQENQQQAGKLLLELADYKISTEVSKILGPLAWEKTTKKDPDDEKRHASGDSNHNDKGSAKPPSKRHKRSNKT